MNFPVPPFREFVLGLSASLCRMALVVCVGARCQAATITVAEVERDPSSERGKTILISLSKDIVRGDAAAFKEKVEPLLSDEDYKRNAVLSLDSGGGHYYEAIAIADFVHSRNITTFVAQSSKCISACALIFMAGKRHPYGDKPYTDRILQIGGTVGFHSPYYGLGPGSFADGVKAARELRAKLGDAIPKDLFIEMLTRSSDETLKITNVYDAGHWGISLTGYMEPTPSRGSMLNACLNHADWQLKRTLGPIAGLADFDEQLDSDDVLLDDQGNVVFNEQGEAIRVKDYRLRSEQDEFVVHVRQTFGAPDLLRFMRSQDGSHAAQFAFDAGDTPLASWCTVVVDVNYANNVFIYRTKMNLRELLAKSRAVIIGVLPAIVPSWYQFPPGTKLDLIAASPTHKVQ